MARREEEHAKNPATSGLKFYPELEADDGPRGSDARDALIGAEQLLKDAHPEANAARDSDGTVIKDKNGNLVGPGLNQVNPIAAANPARERRLKLGAALIAKEGKSFPRKSGARK